MVTDDFNFTADYVIPCNLSAFNVWYDIEVNDGQSFMNLAGTFKISSMIADGSSTPDNGPCDGTATVSPSNGTAPYTTFWGSTSGTALTDSNLCSGSYSVQITDANGCLFDTTIVVNSNPCGNYAISYNPLGNESDTNVCDGAGQAYVNSGAAPFTYEWSHGPTTDVLYNLCGGNYWVSITDNNGCNDTVSFTVETNGPCTNFQLYLEPIFGETSPGACDAVVQVYGNSSNYPITYEWNNGYNYNVDTVCSGNYWVAGTDNIGCMDTISFFVDSIYNPCIAYSANVHNVINVSDTNTCDGSAITSVTYGTEPYTYEWSNGGTADTDAALCFGNQWIAITDANGCADTSFFWVDTVFNACDYYQVYISDNQNESDLGLCDGFGVALGSWGTAPYTYLWSTAETTDSIGGLCAGSYNVVVTDANGCTDSTDLTITTDCTLDFSSSIISDVSCFGLNDGSISVLSDGTAPFLYSIDGGNNIDSVGFYGNLAPGNYTILSEDVNECFGEYNITILEPIALSSITVNKTFPTCGANDGAAQVTAVNGGTAPYSYQWTNGALTAISSNMAAGSYVVTVEDANGCDISQSVNLSSAAAPGITINPTSPTCAGLNNGSIDLVVSGGVAPITFDWSTGAQTEDVANLLAGTYDVTISDAAGCVIVEIITLADVAPINLTNVTKTLASCGLSDGSLTANVTGGTAPYSYNWVTGGSAATETNLAAGSYLLTVTDNNGCIKSKTYSLSNDVAPVITVDQVNQPECEGGNGMIEVSVSGGTTPYTYAWSDGSTNQNLLSAVVGEYELTVTDAGGCKGVEYAELYGINLNAAEICLVSVDTATTGNLVVWTKDYGLGIAEYQIFKETAIANQFQFLQTVPFDSLSQYIDMAANPGVHSYKYKVRTIDSCGNASDFLALHKTIHLSAQMTGSGDIELVWDDYIGINYTQFYIHRYHPSTGWEVLDSVATNVHNYLDGTYPNVTGLEYSIVVLPDSPCTAEKAQDHNSTRSNAATVAFDNAGTGSNVNSNEINSLTIYPNPTNGVFNLSITDSYESMRISIMDINGKMIVQHPIIRGVSQQQLNISNLESGVYFIHAEIDNVNHVVKLIKQ